MVAPGRLNLRPYEGTDTAELIKLFRRAVRIGAAADYSDRERAAWAPDHIDETAWRRRMMANFTQVACLDGRLVGFGELAADGLIHMLYVSPDRERRGIASALLAALEERARADGVVLLATFASRSARGFFEGAGYQLIGTNIAVLGGLELQNFRMEKSLVTGEGAVD